MSPAGRPWCAIQQYHIPLLFITIHYSRDRSGFLHDQPVHTIVSYNESFFWHNKSGRFALLCLPPEFLFRNVGSLNRLLLTHLVGCSSEQTTTCRLQMTWLCIDHLNKTTTASITESVLTVCKTLVDVERKFPSDNDSFVGIFTLIKIEQVFN